MCSRNRVKSKFIKAYDIDEQKGWFSYEWFDSYDKLDYLVRDLKIEDFYSSLKGEGMKLEDYNKLTKICEEENIVLVKDLLRWYNKLDVGLVLKACLKQKEFFYTFKLDMHIDAISLPGLTENILYQHQILGFEEYRLNAKPHGSDRILQLDNIKIVRRIRGYRIQDMNAERDPFKNVTVEEVKYLTERENYCCYCCYCCWQPVKFNTWSWIESIA